MLAMASQFYFQFQFLWLCWSRNLAADQISMRHLNPRLRYDYFGFLKTNCRLVGILLHNDDISREKFTRDLKTFLIARPYSSEPPLRTSVSKCAIQMELLAYFRFQFSRLGNLRHAILYLPAKRSSCWHYIVHYAAQVREAFNPLKPSVIAWLHFECSAP